MDVTWPLCQSGTEAIIHALRNCPSIKSIWHQLRVHPAYPCFFVANLKDRFLSNCNTDPKHDTGEPPWHQVFLLAIWLIWKNRNQYIFKERNLNTMLLKI